MDYRRKLWLLWLIPVGLTLSLLIGLGWLLFPVVPDPDQRDQTLLWLALAAFAIVGGTTAAWAMLDWYCFIPLGVLARGAQIITRSNPGYAVELPRQHWLGLFPTRLQELGEALHKARREVAAEMCIRDRLRAASPGRRASRAPPRRSARRGPCRAPPAWPPWRGRTPWTE